MEDKCPIPGGIFNEERCKDFSAGKEYLSCELLFQDNTLNNDCLSQSMVSGILDFSSLDKEKHLYKEEEALKIPLEANECIPVKVKNIGVSNNYDDGTEPSTSEQNASLILPAVSSEKTDRFTSFIVKDNFILKKVDCIKIEKDDDDGLAKVGTDEDNYYKKSFKSSNSSRQRMPSMKLELLQDGQDNEKLISDVIVDSCNNGQNLIADLEADKDSTSVCLMHVNNSLIEQQYSIDSSKWETDLRSSVVVRKSSWEKLQAISCPTSDKVARPKELELLLNCDSPGHVDFEIFEECNSSFAVPLTFVKNSDQDVTPDENEDMQVYEHLERETELSDVTNDSASTFNGFTPNDINKSVDLSHNDLIKLFGFDLDHSNSDSPLLKQLKEKSKDSFKDFLADSKSQAEAKNLKDIRDATKLTSIIKTVQNIGKDTSTFIKAENDDEKEFLTYDFPTQCEDNSESQEVVPSQAVRKFMMSDSFEEDQLDYEEDPQFDCEVTWTPFYDSMHTERQLTKSTVEKQENFSSTSSNKLSEDDANIPCMQIPVPSAMSDDSVCEKNPVTSGNDVPVPNLAISSNASDSNHNGDIAQISCIVPVSETEQLSKCMFKTTNSSECKSSCMEERSPKNNPSNLLKLSKRHQQSGTPKSESKKAKAFEGKQGASSLTDDQPKKMLKGKCVKSMSREFSLPNLQGYAMNSDITFPKHLNNIDKYERADIVYADKKSCVTNQEEVMHDICCNETEADSFSANERAESIDFSFGQSLDSRGLCAKDKGKSETEAVYNSNEIFLPEKIRKLYFAKDWPQVADMLLHMTQKNFKEIRFEITKELYKDAVNRIENMMQLCKEIQANSASANSACIAIVNIASPLLSACYKKKAWTAGNSIVEVLTDLGALHTLFSHAQGQAKEKPMVMYILEFQCRSFNHEGFYQTYFEYVVRNSDLLDPVYQESLASMLIEVYLMYKNKLIDEQDLCQRIDFLSTLSLKYKDTKAMSNIKFDLELTEVLQKCIDGKEMRGRFLIDACHNCEVKLSDDVVRNLVDLFYPTGKVQNSNSLFYALSAFKLGVDSTLYESAVHNYDKLSVPVALGMSHAELLCATHEALSSLTRSISVVLEFRNSHRFSLLPCSDYIETAIKVLKRGPSRLNCIVVNLRLAQKGLVLNEDDVEKYCKQFFNQEFERSDEVAKIKNKCQYKNNFVDVSRRYDRQTLQRKQSKAGSSKKWVGHRSHLNHGPDNQRQRDNLWNGKMNFDHAKQPFQRYRGRSDIHGNRQKHRNQSNRPTFCRWSGGNYGMGSVPSDLPTRYSDRFPLSEDCPYLKDDSTMALEKNHIVTTNFDDYHSSRNLLQNGCQVSYSPMPYPLAFEEKSFEFSNH